MSNNVSIFRDQSVMTLGSGDALDEVTKRLLSAGGANKRISIAGGKFRMIVNGQEAARSNNDSMDIVIVNAAPHVGRAFYSKAFDPRATGLPDCWSNDGVRPEAKSEAPQSKTCETCPKNVAGSGANGTRACRYNRRLAVTLANDVENSDVYQLQLPATSLFGKGEGDKLPFDAYVKQLVGFKHSITGVVTEMKFDEAAVGGPRLIFRAVRPLNVTERAAVAEKTTSPDALAAISFTPGQMDAPAAPQAPASISAPTAPAVTAEVPEPTIRGKNTATAPVESKNVTQLLDEWADD